jgi:hypothetical protein
MRLRSNEDLNAQILLKLENRVGPLIIFKTP